jgi:ppGpp synthetase/RelA/SpoT-type nucleotidyltranferase
MNYEMAWIEPAYSKKAVGRAGKALTEGQGDSEALQIANNWRAAHAYSLNRVQSNLRYWTKKVSPDSHTVTQRLKRMASVRGKLKRFPEMSLHRMQDLGGCRAIVPTIRQVYELRDKLTHSGKAVVARDYIAAPREETGYRSLHLKSKHQGDDKWVGLCTEIQLRTEIQHAWATAVEIAGTFLKEDLKSGIGSPARLEYFRKVSLLFAKLEEDTAATSGISESEWSQLRAEVASATNKLGIDRSLSTFAVIIDSLPESSTDGYLVLRLDLHNNQISGVQYASTMLTQAVKQYEIFEMEEEKYDTVLVSGKSIKELRRGYANYFADSQLFRQLLQEVIST